jgi:hypothetical protein
MILFVLADGLAKLFLPTLNSMSPKNAVLPIHRLPLKLAAFFDLRFEKLLPIERHGLSLIKRGREISVAPDFARGAIQRAGATWQRQNTTQRATGSTNGARSAFLSVMDD